MIDDQPLVTVGLPVYNGADHLAEALAAVVAQDYARLQIIVCDNASTDATAEICQRFAAVDSRIHYVRNAENIGMLGNFCRVAELAHGKYFFWAAHDDRWNAQYVTRLVECLEAAPHAMLAGPAVIHTGEDGHLIHEPVDRPALSGPPLDNLKRLYADHAIGWYYGLWRTDWLQQHLDEVRRWPLWGGDVIWLASLSLRNVLTGDDRAILYKRLKPSSLAPKTARAKVWFWAYMFWYLGQVSLEHGRTRRERNAALTLSCRYVYRACIRRPSLLSTAFRVGKLLTLAAITYPSATLWRWLVDRSPIATNSPAATAADSSLDKISRAA